MTVSERGGLSQVNIGGLVPGSVRVMVVMVMRVIVVVMRVIVVVMLVIVVVMRVYSSGDGGGDGWGREGRSSLPL